MPRKRAAVADVTSLPSTKGNRTAAQPQTTNDVPEAPPADASCGICLDIIKIRGGLGICEHLFCFDCIQKWAERENTCPMCKQRFLSIKELRPDASGGFRAPERGSGNLVRVSRRNQRYEPEDDLMFAHQLAMRFPFVFGDSSDDDDFDDSSDDDMDEDSDDDDIDGGMGLTLRQDLFLDFLRLLVEQAAFPLRTPLGAPRIPMNLGPVIVDSDLDSDSDSDSDSDDEDQGIPVPLDFELLFGANRRYVPQQYQQQQGPAEVIDLTQDSDNDEPPQRRRRVDAPPIPQQHLPRQHSADQHSDYLQYPVMIPHDDGDYEQLQYDYSAMDQPVSMDDALMQVLPMEEPQHQAPPARSSAMPTVVPAVATRATRRRAHAVRADTVTDTVTPSAVTPLAVTPVEDISAAAEDLSPRPRVRVSARRSKRTRTGTHVGSDAVSVHNGAPSRAKRSRSRA